MDMNEIAGLLHIAEKANQWPKLKPIHDEVMRMLEGHAEEMKANAEKRAKSMPKAVPAVKEEPEDEPQTANADGPVRRREVPEEVNHGA